MVPGPIPGLAGLFSGSGLSGLAGLGHSGQSGLGLGSLGLGGLGLGINLGAGLGGICDFLGGCSLPTGPGIGPMSPMSPMSMVGCGTGQMMSGPGTTTTSVPRAAMAPFGGAPRGASRNRRGQSPFPPAPKVVVKEETDEPEDTKDSKEKASTSGWQHINDPPPPVFPAGVGANMATPVRPNECPRSPSLSPATPPPRPRPTPPRPSQAPELRSPAQDVMNDMTGPKPGAGAGAAEAAEAAAAETSAPAPAQASAALRRDTPAAASAAAWVHQQAREAAHSRYIAAGAGSRVGGDGPGGHAGPSLSDRRQYGPATTYQLSADQGFGVLKVKRPDSFLQAGLQRPKPVQAALSTALTDA